jgi:hypothetical protein
MSRVPANESETATTPGYRIDPDTDCWEWQGYVDRNGYGRIYDRTRPKNRRTDWVHRVFYERHKGPIPERHEIDHTCQNTICVNPDHLDAVTKAEHVARTYQRLGKDRRHEAAAALRATGLTYGEIADALEFATKTGAHLAVRRAIDKGLVDPASLPVAIRLTDSEREDVRDLYALGVPQTELAAWYGIDSSAVSRICNHLNTKAARRAKGLAA